MKQTQPIPPKPKTRTGNKPRLAYVDDALRGRIMRHVAKLEGWAWLMIEPAKRARSLSQNAWYWACVIPALRDALNSYGVSQHPLNSDEAHDWAKLAFLPPVTVNAGGITRHLPAPSKTLTTEQFGELCEKCRALVLKMTGEDVPDPRKDHE
jgi:hypothetical protein